MAEHGLRVPGLLVLILVDGYGDRYIDYTAATFLMSSTMCLDAENYYFSMIYLFIHLF